MRRAIALVACALSVAALSCGHPKRRTIVPQPVVIPEPPPPPPPWEQTIDSVRTFVAAHQYAEAERTLAAFAVAHAGTPEAAESDFWRALLLSDPANAEATSHDAIAALDAYIARGASAPRYLEALTLKRLIASGDTLRSTIAATRAAADQRDRARTDELAKKQLELDSVSTELERIKRRLSGRRP